MRRLLGSDYFVLLLCVLWLTLLGPFTPGLLSTENAANVLTGMLPLLILATGQTLVLVGGGIDLSAPSVIALTSVAGAKLMTQNGGLLHGHGGVVLLGVLSMVGLGAAIGWVNGMCITRLGMPAFMVTLTTMMFASGFAIWTTKSANISGLPVSFFRLGQSLPAALALALFPVGAVQLLLSRSRFGYQIRAVGFNPQTARVSGVPAARVLTLSCVISGLCAGLASVLLSARLETGSPVLGQMMMLDVIGACVIGGTSLFGGRGSVAGTAGGVLFLTLLDNALGLRGVPHYKIMVVKGAVILLAAGLDVFRRRNVNS